MMMMDDSTRGGESRIPMTASLNTTQRRPSALCSCNGGTCPTWTTWHVCCNTVGLIGLGVLVILMGIQLHAVEGQLAADEAEIAALQEQVASQTQNQQDLNQRVEQEHSLTLYQMAGTFTLLTCLITAFHITQHLSNFNEAVVQRKIIAILWMSPIYSVTSFLSLVFPSADEYLAVVKDCYEAYTIYNFLSFLIAVLGRGDRDAAVQVLAGHPLHPPAACWRSCFYPAPETSPTAMAHAVLMECQILALQFVFIRPITSLLTFVTDTLNEHEEENGDDGPYAYFMSPNFYIAMVTNISVFFAFNGLLKFYHAVRDDLKWCQPFSKFLSIKSIVFLTFWQGLLISIIVNVNHEPPPSSAEILTPTMAPVIALSPTVPSFPYSTTLAPSPSTGMRPETQKPAVWNGNSTRHLQWLRQLEDETAEEPLNEDRVDESEPDTNLDDNDEEEVDDEDEPVSNAQRAALIQNFLICLEMLLFSLAHWCVFPAEEWRADYRPQTYSKPGLALKDFAKDISYIVRSRRAAYHQPSAASNKTEEEEEDSERQRPNGSDVEMSFADAARAEEEDDEDDLGMGTLT